MNSALYENNLSSVLWRHTISIVKAVNVEDFQFFWGKSSVLLGMLKRVRGNHQYCERCSLLWRNIISTLEVTPTVMISPTVLMVSPTVLHILHSTDGFSPQYWWYPQQYWAPSKVMKSFHSTEHPPQLWNPSTALMMFFRSTDGIPHSTKHLP